MAPGEGAMYYLASGRRRRRPTMSCCGAGSRHVRHQGNLFVARKRNTTGCTGDSIQCSLKRHVTDNPKRSDLYAVFQTTEFYKIDVGFTKAISMRSSGKGYFAIDCNSNENRLYKEYVLSPKWITVKVKHSENYCGVHGCLAISKCLAVDSARTAVVLSTMPARQSGTRCRMNLEILTVLIVLNGS